MCHMCPTFVKVSTHAPFSLCQLKLPNLSIIGQHMQRRIQDQQWQDQDQDRQFKLKVNLFITDVKRKHAVTT